MSRATCCLMLSLFLGFLSVAHASSGHPVAVRWWGQAMISIETHWNLTVVIDPYGEKIGYKNPNVMSDLVLITHEYGDHNNASLIGGQPIVERGLDKRSNARSFSMVLDRFPGAEKPKWYNARRRVARSGHAIQVTSIPAWHDDTEGSQRGSNTLFLIEVDNQRVLHCGNLGQSQLTDDQLKQIGRVDVLLLPVGGVYTVDGTQAADIVGQIQPRIVVPMHYKTPNLADNLQGVSGFLTAMGADTEIVRVRGNTLAISTTKRQTTKPQVAVLGFVPWEMPQVWADLFAAKEKSCRASQAVFTQLSVEQMNFRPSNGTHTPRWNTEHMMGRELLFFSQIFSQVDPAIQVLDLNPKQMPPDYVAAHPDWSGAEEARQMERVLAFTRRFAYLLDDLPLDEKAPGSFWTPRKLLKQMDRHYSEHTANVRKKFELPDWPGEVN